MMNMVDVRAAVLDRIREDLVGYGSDEEVLDERPADRYLFGILYPPGERVGESEDDDAGEEAGAPSSENPGEVGDVPIHRSLRPSTFGLSFRVSGQRPQVVLEISGGRYEETEPSGNLAGGWKRSPIRMQIPLALRSGFHRKLLATQPPMTVAIRSIPAGTNTFAATVVVSNVAKGDKGGTWTEENSLFQASMTLTARDGTTFVPRPIFGLSVDEEEQSASLLYRAVREYAVGHTCSATWNETDPASTISSTWLPRSTVPSVSPLGAASLAEWANSDGASAAWIVKAPVEALTDSLDALSAAYRAWIESKAPETGLLTNQDRATADRHLSACREAAERMEAGADLIASNEAANRAFRLANRAMVLQRQATEGPAAQLRWRPFQMAFQLINLPSLADPQHVDRRLMDLLWFPTGGGKTEAYLGLIAFLLFHRRLRSPTADAGAGVAAIMRYTLRVLTSQQFQRAAAVIAACEEIRQGEGNLGSAPFSIGLWIGGDATPNTTKDAIDRLADLKVLTSCPRCGELLTNPAKGDLRQRCRNEQCVFYKQPLPVYVIDDEIYEKRPSLIVATVDKFAQITRRTEAGRLFALDKRYGPPDLILQDELHLISGPLGTLAGLYEIAIDSLSSWSGTRPKVIGSTATIRRAGDQVRSLFEREVRLFPPPGIEDGDSGFAKEDLSGHGRLYVGIPTTGRSPKFALQAVLASVAQAAGALSRSASPEAVDPFWTCVTYFNSIRELGGAVVLVEDDVRRSIERIADRRFEAPRHVDVPSEITSRVPTREIPELLAQLGTSYPDSEIDMILASNMISVGVDVPRLGLMVVNGQPKTTSEYIQATSRVGRGQTPGVVLVVYNSQRARDRSRYESFETWHQALYRDVEATSVTPFAPRARDRALHAPLVAMLRLLFPPPNDSPLLDKTRADAVSAVVRVILERVDAIDPDEHRSTADQLQRLIDDWMSKGGLREWWWNSWQQKPALMISAEDQATLNALDMAADAWSTPNSMRDVEASTRFRLAEGLSRQGRSR